MVELFSIACCIGIVARNAGADFFIVSVLSIVCFVACAGYLRSARGAAFAAFVALGIALGAIVYSAAVPTVVEHSRSEIRGIVATVDRRLDKSVIVITSGDLDVQASVSDDSLLPGDEVLVRGAFVPPKDFVTDSGRMFGYRDYLQSRRIALVAQHASVEIVSRGNFSITRAATVARFSIAHALARAIAFPLDSIVSGMLVGYQGNIPEDVTKLFRDTGVLHTLVLSGSNVSLLALALSVIFKPLPFKVRSVASMLAIIALILVSGAGVSAIRAGIMGTLALLSGMLRRGYVPLRAFSLSALFFLIFSPLTVCADPGFQLSFLATAFIILVVPKIEPFFSFIPDSRMNLRALFALAFVFPLFMLPYTMYFSGFVSLASPVANLLLDVLIPFFMAGGALVLALCWLPPVASFLGALLSALGAVMLTALRLLAHVPRYNTPALSWLVVDACYAAILIVLYRSELTLFFARLRMSLPPRSN